MPHCFPTLITALSRAGHHELSSRTLIALHKALDVFNKVAALCDAA